MKHLLALLTFCLATSPTMAEPIRIAVASNFKPTLAAVNASYPLRNSQKVVLSSASTGVLASQIEHGAPFDLFFSADRSSAQRLAEKRSGEIFCYAQGKLALVGGTTEDLANSTKSLAIANPVTAPYGRAAKEVLSRPEFASGAERKLVRGANVAQAYQFWHSGAVDLALIPLSLAPATAIAIDPAWHAPIEQFVFVARRSPQLDRYLDWFRSDTVRAQIQASGYKLCL